MHRQLSLSTCRSLGRARAYASAHHEVVIAAASRTPITSIGGALASMTAPELGAAAIADVLAKARVEPGAVGEVYMGNVIGTGLKQAPSRQAALGAGLPKSVVTTDINKVCASGMKAVMVGSQSIMLGHQTVVVAGGMESMSNIPYMVKGARYGLKYGHTQFLDVLAYDGLSDAYSNTPMGTCGDFCAEKYGITRKEQDDFAIRSYKLALDSVSSGAFHDEIVPVSVPQKKGDPVVVSLDDEPAKVKFDKIPTLAPAFGKNGTVTAANSSKLDDGASATILMSAAEAARRGVQPLARIVGFADASTEPIEFPVAPALAIPKALKMAGINDVSKIDLWEINEAFAVVVLANAKLLGMSLDKVNTKGGACALGHPIGNSGSRILVTLAHALKQKGLRYGCAAICNGGGGASAVVLENLSYKN
jgi:acetyl-CoA C-acetyltransferase